MLAREKFTLRILPAGRDDRMAEISDTLGNVLRYIHCPHRLGDSTGGLDVDIRKDFQSLEANEFAKKYEIPFRDEKPS